MNTQEIYQAAFNDELEKIAGIKGLDQLGKMGRSSWKKSLAIGAGAGAAAGGASYMALMGAIGKDGRKQVGKELDQLKKRFKKG